MRSRQTKVTWGDLFNYIERTIKPRLNSEDPELLDDDCEEDFTVTMRFCKKHKIDFRFVSKVLMETWASCDCSALYGSSLHVRHEIEIGSPEELLVEGLDDLRWHDLFEYVNEKCNFHEEVLGNPGSVKWKCSGEFDYVGEFCKQHHLHDGHMKGLLRKAGVYCDCEVILNAVRYINPEERIMLPSFAPPSQASA